MIGSFIKLIHFNKELLNDTLNESQSSINSTILYSLVLKYFDWYFQQKDIKI